MKRRRKNDQNGPKMDKCQNERPPDFLKIEFRPFRKQVTSVLAGILFFEE